MIPDSNGPRSIVLFGVESNFTPEFLETARRTGDAVVAAVITGELEWDLSGLPVEPLRAVAADLLPIPVAIPWVTPGLRFARWRHALDIGFSRQAGLVDPSAVIASSVRLGEGIYINAGATIGADAHLDDGVLVNRNASVGHHARLERYVSLGPAVTICSECHIGKGAMIGAGAVVAPKIQVGDNSVVAVGAVVAKNVPAQCVVAGNPARIVRSDIAGYKDVSVD
ncbi:MAG: acetyltransferase [Rhizobiales bacterium]|nr:acetyltransferase [Hyphomicrobiales bacterium]